MMEEGVGAVLQSQGGIPTSTWWGREGVEVGAFFELDELK